MKIIQLLEAVNEISAKIPGGWDTVRPFLEYAVLPNDATVQEIPDKKLLNPTPGIEIIYLGIGYHNYTSSQVNWLATDDVASAFASAGDAFTLYVKSANAPLIVDDNPEDRDSLLYRMNNSDRVFAISYKKLKSKNKKHPVPLSPNLKEN